MKIGVIIYSLSGNTRHVATRLQDKLAAAGHEVSLEEITITGNTPAQPGKFELQEMPDPERYEALIFGAPVQAFSLNPVMKAYLEKLPPLNGKRTAVFVTKQLALLRIGGTGAIGMMKKTCAEKGAKVAGDAIVVWAGKKREESIGRCVEKISALFPA